MLTKADLNQIKEAMGIDKLLISFTTVVENVNKSIMDRIDVLEKSLAGEYTKLNEKVVALESSHDELKEMVISNLDTTKATSSNNSEKINNLQDKIVDLEKSLHKAFQHGRKSNIVIDGIPNEVGEDPLALERVTINLLTSMGVKCEEKDIEAIHRLPGKKDANKPTIVKFASRKSVDAVFKHKSKLKNLEALNVIMDGLNSNSNIYIRPNLSPYFKTLAYNCRLLKRDYLIERVLTENDGTLKIKTLHDGYCKIAHESDLVTRFPMFRKFKFTWD